MKKSRSMFAIVCDKGTKLAKRRASDKRTNAGGKAYRAMIERQKAAQATK